DASLGGLLGLYEILDTRLKTPVYDYFNDATDPPTTDGFLTALEGISGTSTDLSITVASLTGGYDADDNEIRFSLNFGANRDGVVCLDAGAKSDNVFDSTSLELSVNPEIVPVSSQFSKTSDSSLSSSIEGKTLDLPGLRLVDPDTSCFEGQIFWLNFEGAEDVTYNGPVTIEHIDIPAYKALDAFAGQEQEIISGVLEELTEIFTLFGISFATEQPDGQDAEFSTIYIGGNCSLFADYGSFLGLAEQVDVGNENPTDNAFIFSEMIGRSRTDSSIYIDDLSSVIAHEVGRLLGYESEVEREAGGLLGSVAQTGTIVSDYAAEVQSGGGIALPGMHLVDPTVDYFDGQTVYLDFNGEADVTYNGPVVVEGINIPEFCIDAAGLAGQE
ncbi:hypothetical protein KA005_71825, partial [bacterium]|nr:hypothetical protein [bacterium]